LWRTIFSRTAASTPSKFLSIHWRELARDGLFYTRAGQPNEDEDLLRLAVRGHSIVGTVTLIREHEGAICFA